MTTFASAVTALETATGLNSTVKQVVYITIVAERNARNVVAKRELDHNKVMGSLTFAINNENTDLSWACGGSVAYWETQADATLIARKSARSQRKHIMNLVTIVREGLAAK